MKYKSLTQVSHNDPLPALGSRLPRKEEIKKAEEAVARKLNSGDLIPVAGNKDVFVNKFTGKFETRIIENEKANEPKVELSSANSNMLYFTESGIEFIKQEDLDSISPVKAYFHPGDFLTAGSISASKITAGSISAQSVDNQIKKSYGYLESLPVDLSANTIPVLTKESLSPKVSKAFDLKEMLALLDSFKKGLGLVSGGFDPN